MISKGGTIRVRGLAKSFGALEVIKDIDLDISAARRHLIIGPNGAGKTTFFNLLSGQLTASRGDIEFNGETITHMPIHLRARRGLGRTFQIASLFEGLSVWDNIVLAASAPALSDRSTHAIARRAVSALEQSGLEAKRAFPVRRLAYGEQRRLEIALSLATSPTFILLDEPMAGLTPEERRALATLIIHLSNTVGVVLIEHDLEIALTIAQRLTVFHLGQVVVDGEPDEVLSNPLVREIYLG
jgi:ABC-type branched-subunit amino acid transport system ATPase component